MSHCRITHDRNFDRQSFPYQRRNQPFTPVIETMRGLWMGHTSTGASTGHEALLAGLYCAVILALSVLAASWLFRHRTVTH
jgi:ABC-2 type transport system permease protein